MEEVTSIKRFNEILSRYPFVFVDFSAEWCGPCRRIAPLIEDLAEEYRNIKFIKLDCDDFGELCKRYKVRSLPTFILFNEEEVVETIEGAKITQVKYLLDRFKTTPSF